MSISNQPRELDSSFYAPLFFFEGRDDNLSVPFDEAEEPTLLHASTRALAPVCGREFKRPVTALFFPPAQSEELTQLKYPPYSSRLGRHRVDSNTGSFAQPYKNALVRISTSVNSPKLDRLAPRFEYLPGPRSSYVSPYLPIEQNQTFKLELSSEISYRQAQNSEKKRPSEMPFDTRETTFSLNLYDVANKVNDHMQLAHLGQAVPSNICVALQVSLLSIEDLNASRKYGMNPENASFFASSSTSYLNRGIWQSLIDSETSFDKVNNYPEGFHKLTLVFPQLTGFARSFDLKTGELNKSHAFRISGADKSGRFAATWDSKKMGEVVNLCLETGHAPTELPENIFSDLKSFSSFDDLSQFETSPCSPKSSKKFRSVRFEQRDSENNDIDRKKRKPRRTPGDYTRDSERRETLRFTENYAGVDSSFTDEKLDINPLISNGKKAERESNESFESLLSAMSSSDETSLKAELDRRKTQDYQEKAAKLKEEKRLAALAYQRTLELESGATLLTKEQRKEIDKILAEQSSQGSICVIQ